MSEPMLCPHCLNPLEAGAEACPACGEKLAGRNPRGTLACGTQLAGRYTVGRVLSADGEGIRYAAADNKAAIRVVIKEYLPVTLAADRSSAGAIRPREGSEVLYKTTRMDFVDLYHELLKLMPMPGMELVLDVFEANNTAYAVTERLTGTVTLEKYLQTAGGKIGAKTASRLLQPIFDGISAMHAAGLVHRGVSPANIRVSAEGRAKLTGYATLGLRMADSGLRPQLYAGYTAPEQYSRASFEGRYTDVYALAAVYYRAVTGIAPLSAEMRLAEDTVEPVNAILPSLPEWLGESVAQGMLLDGKKRIQTVPQLAAALASPMPEAPEKKQARIEAARRAEAEKKKKQRIAVIAGAAVVVLLLLVLLLHGCSGGTAASETPEETPAASAEQTTIPSFVGMTYTELQNSADFKNYYFTLKTAYDDEAEAGVIIAQSPEGGTAVDAGTTPTITLTVSSGKESVELPNLVGFTQQAAIDELTAAGIEASCVVITNDGSYVEGCVVKTNPAAGTAVQPGSTVIVYVADEIVATPTPAPTPSPTPNPTDIPNQDFGSIDIGEGEDDGEPESTAPAN